MDSNPDVVRCRQCGRGNTAGSLYCTECGSSLSPACAQCGAELPPEARFCPSCGRQVDPIRARTEERKLVTILFADVTGSTGLGERFDPEDMARVMSTYFEAMRSEIEAEGGTVEKFIGDAVMAVFGVPVAHEDDPARALHAALRMMDRLNEVNKELTKSQGVSLEMRVGINTGEVLAHTDPQPGEPMVTGDVVNVASRLQTAAQPGRILVAERSARAVRRFNFNEVGDLQLRGKSIPVKAFELIGHAAGGSERGIPGLVAPMVGRDSELSLLQSVYHRTRTEVRPNLVTLYGEAGVGKSRLTTEFLDWARTAESPPIILRGRCLPYGDGIAYWPLAEILKQAAGIRDTDPSSEALERIRALGQELLSSAVTNDPELSVAVLAHTMGVADPDHSFADLDPREVKTLTNAAWRSMFTALSAQAPVVTIIEDIHWADPALLDILEELTEKVKGPLLLVCPARPELTERRPGWGGGRRNQTSIYLDPLTPADSDTLVGLLLAIADLPAGVRRSIMDTAEGNPFFLEEIVRHLIDQGHLIRKGDAWVASSEIGEVDIPDTVQAVLAARIDLLDPTEKRVLQRAAVVGRIFWPSPVARLLDGVGDVVPVLDHLEERELIQSRLGSSLAGEPEYIFKHVLTREVAYEMLPRRERGAAHAEVATWIEESTGDRAGELVELVAYHWAEAYHAAEDDSRTSSERIADLRQKAFTSTIEASRASRGRAAVARARRFAEQAMTFAADPLDRASAMNARGLAALFDYDGDVAWFSLKEEVDFLLEHAPEQRRSIARACARAVETPFRWPGSMKTLIPEEEVIRYIEIGIANLDPDEESEEMVRLLLARSMGLFARWKPDEIDTAMVQDARAAGERAVEIAHALGRVDLAAAALDAVGSVEQSLGDYRAHTEVLNRRLPLLERMTNPWEIGDALAMGSNNFAYIGDYPQALRLAEEGVTRTVDSSARGLVLHNTTWVSFSEFWLGNWDRVVTDLAARIRAMLGDRASDPPYFAGHQFGVEAFIHTARRDGKMAESRELLTRMVDGAEASAGSQGGLIFKGWEAWIRARDGDVTEALRRLDRLSSQARVRPLVDVVKASVLLDAGLFTDVDVFIEGSREYAEWAGIVALPPHLGRLEGAKVLAAGDTESAITLLTKAKTGFSELGTPWELARTELWLAEAHIESGELERAAQAIESAGPVLERLGSVPEIERARALLKRL